MIPAVGTLKDLSPILPEIILAIGLLALLLAGTFLGDRAAGRLSAFSVLLVGAAALAVVITPADGRTFAAAVVLDPFARFMKLLALIGSAAVLVMSQAHGRQAGLGRFEYPLLIIAATLGMMMMIGGNDLISVYLGLELLSLSSYVLAAIDRDSLRSTEAGLKYFVLGALSSGMLLYGASLTYGFTGQTSFSAIAAAIAGHDAPLGLTFGLVFLVAGLAFKVAAVPFHMWTPDVYEGAPTPVTAFFATAPKVAAMALLVRVTAGPFGPVVHQWQQVITFLAIASMILGAFAAIGQRNIKRLMAYSAISHVGYALLGLAAGSHTGVQAVILYLAVYLVMNLGAFACILAARRDGAMIENIDDLAGMSRSHPVVAFLFAMILFSLAGIPPLAGFLAKFYVFMAAVQAGLVWLAVIGVLTSVVAAFYYLRIIKVLYFDDPVGAFEPMPRELKVILGASGILVMLFALFAGDVAAAADDAARTFF